MRGTALQGATLWTGICSLLASLASVVVGENAAATNVYGGVLFSLASGENSIPSAPALVSEFIPGPSTPGRPRFALASMPHIRVEVKRSDCEENDVSASKHHLNERAEERKEEEEQIARCGETRAAAAAAAAAAATVAAAVAAPAVAAINGTVAAEGSSTVEANDISNNNVSDLKNCDVVGRASDATTAITTAPATVAAPGENPSSKQGEGGGETTLETLEKQTSMIQADRTDGENWDAKDLGKTSGGCWCWRWRRRNVKRSGSLT